MIPLLSQGELLRIILPYLSYPEVSAVAFICLGNHQGRHCILTNKKKYIYIRILK